MRVLNEACGMAGRGHQILLAAPERSRIYAEALRRGLGARPLPIEHKSLAGYFALRALIKSESVQVVNTHSSTDSWLTALSCIGLGKLPVVVRTRHISAPIPANAMTRWLYARAAARVVTTGEALRLQVIRETGAEPTHVMSVPTGVDLSRFQPGNRDAARASLGLARGDFLVGIVATLRSWKGHRYLLDALARIPDERVKVVIVGGGPGESNLRRQAADLGLAERVVMIGQKDDVVPWLQSFDAFVLPSYANEGVPQAIMQAMACGLAIITTNIGAIGEVASDGITALMVRPRDADSVAKAILLLHDDPALRERLGAAALIEAKSRFSEKIMLERMEAVFLGAIGDKAPIMVASA